MSFSAHFGPLSDDRGAQATALTWVDLNRVRVAVAEIAPRWSAELNQASLDDSTIVVLPEGANDLLGPAFVLHRTGGRVHLDQFRWDEYRKLGGFGSLDEALSVMRARLALLVSKGPAKAVADH
ncbi:MAG: hypothetical protein EXR07_02425 [Acetobacteraceae bacterium]|nr:hypothetical protein [Acetobacteraceae bacterium]